MVSFFFAPTLTSSGRAAGVYLIYVPFLPGLLVSSQVLRAGSPRTADQLVARYNGAALPSGGEDLAKLMAGADLAGREDIAAECAARLRTRPVVDSAAELEERLLFCQPRL